MPDPPPIPSSSISQASDRDQPEVTRPRSIRAVVGLLAFLIPIVVYLLTLAREITFIDSGELTAAAATLGIAHPPGYPLFSLLGRVCSLLPVGSIAFRVGL